MTIVGTELHFMGGRICVKVSTVANGKVVGEDYQDVTAAVAQSISRYIFPEE